MLDLLTIPAGLIGSALFFAYCKVVASAVLPPFGVPERARYERLAALVLQFGVGLSIVGFVAIALGAAGLLTALEIALALALLPALVALWRPAVLAPAFWRGQLEDVRASLDAPAAAIVGLFALASIGNILPETGFDVTEYHYAYALEWAHAARIFADPFMAEPYFANNFQALYATAFALHLGLFLHFLNWMCGLFATLCCYAIVRLVLASSLPASDAAPADPIAVGCGLGAAFVAVFSPWYLSYLGSVIDIPIGCMTAVPILGFLLWHRTKDDAALVAATVTAGYAIGMKSSLLAYLALYYALFAWASRTIGAKRAIALAAGMTVLASPWYVRNTIAVGDPTPPVLNMLLRGSDPIYSQDDMTRGNKDLHKTRDDGSILTLPIRLFIHPTDLTYVETGVPAIVAATYVPLVIFAWIAVRRRRVRSPGDVERLVLYGATAFPIVLWLATATEARYLLESFPLICASLAVAVGIGMRRLGASAPSAPGSRYAVAGGLAFAGVLAALPHAGLALYAQTPVAQSLALTASGISPRLYLVDFVRGYQEIQYATDIARSADPPGTLLQFGFENLHMYSADQNVTAFGNWSGPGRYFDAIDAADRGMLPQYLEAHRVAAVVVDRSGRTIGTKDAQTIASALLRDAYFRVSPPGDPIEIYARRAIR